MKKAKKPVFWTMIIRWEEWGDDGHLVEKEFLNDVSDSVNEYASKGEYDAGLEEDMIANKAWPIKQAAGDKFHAFTHLSIVKEK